MFPVRAFSAFKNGTKVLKIRPGTLAGLKKVLKPQFFKTGLTNFFPVYDIDVILKLSLPRVEVDVAIADARLMCDQLEVPTVGWLA